MHFIRSGLYYDLDYVLQLLPINIYNVKHESKEVFTMTPAQKRSAAAKKAAATRKRNALAAKRSEAAKKAAATRKRNALAAKRSAAAVKANKTRKRLAKG